MRYCSSECSARLKFAEFIFGRGSAEELTTFPSLAEKGYTLSPFAILLDACGVLITGPANISIYFFSY